MFIFILMFISFKYQFGIFGWIGSGRKTKHCKLTGFVIVPTHKSYLAPIPDNTRDARIGAKNEIFNFYHLGIS